MIQVLTTKNVFSVPPNNGEWVQVDLGKPNKVFGIVTQGRPSDYDQYMTRYTIAYKNSTSNFIAIQQRNGDKLVIIKIKLLFVRIFDLFEKSIFKVMFMFFYKKKISMPQYSNFSNIANF